jgi:hypothetical protein
MTHHGHHDVNAAALQQESKQRHPTPACQAANACNIKVLLQFLASRTHNHSPTLRLCGRPLVEFHWFAPLLTAMYTIK